MKTMFRNKVNTRNHAGFVSASLRFVLVAAVSLLTLVGCSDIQSVSISEASQNKSSGKAYVSFSVNDINSGARSTINPTNVTESDISRVEFIAEKLGSDGKTYEAYPLDGGIWDTTEQAGDGGNTTTYWNFRVQPEGLESKVQTNDSYTATLSPVLSNGATLTANGSVMWQKDDDILFLHDASVSYESTVSSFKRYLTLTVKTTASFGIVYKGGGSAEKERFIAIFDSDGNRIKGETNLVSSQGKKEITIESLAAGEYKIVPNGTEVFAVIVGEPSALKRLDEVMACASPWTGDSFNIDTTTITALASVRNAKLPLDIGTYNFTLNLYTGGNGVYRLVQTGTLSAQTITNGANTLEFTTAYVETGDVEVTLTFASNARIGRVKAGLFKDIQCATPLTYTLAETDTELSCDLEIISIEDGKTEGLKKAVYRKSDIPNGTYYIKFSVYGIETDADGNEIETQLNTIMDVLKVKGYITTGECTLSAVNTIYSIEYKLGGGSWADNFAPTEKRNANTGVLLPTKTDLTVPEGCVFAGWYEVDEKGAPTDTDENGNPVILTKIGTGTDTAKDYLLSALWKAKPAFDASIIVNTSDIDANYEQNNATLTFTVTPPDNDATYSYQWTVDGAEKEPTTSAEFTVDGSTWATGMYDISLVVTETKTDSESGETKTKYYSYTAQINWTRLYTILFDITGAPEGTNVPVSQYIEENGTVATPKDSDGNELTPTYGWYTNSNFSNAFDLTETVTKSMTLYGCWDLNGNIYVSENGTDDDGRGTAGNPLATIASALALMTDSNTDYTIYIDGTISGEQKIQSSSALAKSITLTGKNGPDSRNEPQDALYGGFKAESSGRTLTVSTTVPVIIENLKITGGYLTDSGSFGGGLSVASGADVTLTGYTQITGNTATRGGGVDVDGTLTMKDSALISGNTATALYGGGAYVGSNGVLDMQAGEIFGNDISGTPSDGEEKQGYGVYVCGSSGKLKIGGSAVIGNDDDTVPNDVYLASGTKIIITSELMGGVTTATITPSSYSTTTQWIEADVDDNGNPVVDLATECTSFAVTPQTITDSATGTTRTINWRITETGYLQQLEVI